MVDEELKHRMDHAIADNKDFGAAQKILREFKRNGGKQQDALDTLEHIRKDAPEIYEDCILDVMDIASGFCTPQDKVWP